MRRALTVALVALVPASASAWQPISGSRPVWDGAHVTWELNDRGSDDLDFATVQAETRRGMEDWTRVGCTSLSTTYEGTTSNSPRGGDGNHTIGWTESGWGHSSSAIGVTGSRFTSGRIVEADMDMNGVHFTWATGSGSGNRVNLYSIALHEGGHFYGLGHSSDRSATMYFAYSGGVAALNADDEAGICALYPGSGGSTTDCTTSGCPGGSSCMDGACVPDSPPPSGGGDDVCAPCTSSGACGGSGDFCLGYPDGRGYCGAACGTSSDCGAGERCVGLSNGARQCVRFDGDRATCASTAPPAPECASDSDCDASERCDGGACVPTGGGAAAGAPCALHSDCGTGTCFAGTCTQSCDWPGGACPSGFYCDGGATGACGPGVCLAGSAGAGADGEACDGPTDCASAHCDRGRCATPCEPGAIGACDDGQVCQVGALACRGACGVTGSAGDPCAGNDDCASGICADRLDGAGYCTALCDETSPCAPGFRCGSGPVRVCEPDGAPLGDACASNGACASGICAEEDDRTYCTRVCDASTPCPGAMACVASATSGVSVCVPSADAEPPGDRHLAGGCAVGPTPSSTPLSGWALLLLALAWRAARARRCHPGSDGRRARAGERGWNAS